MRGRDALWILIALAPGAGCGIVQSHDLSTIEGDRARAIARAGSSTAGKSSTATSPRPRRDDAVIPAGGTFEETPSPRRKITWDNDADPDARGAIVQVSAERPAPGGLRQMTAAGEVLPPLTVPPAPSEASDGTPSAPAMGEEGKRSLKPADNTPAAVPFAGRPLELGDVVLSVRQTYPLLAAAFEARDIAAGDQTEAWGEFDLKLKHATIRQPQGYYKYHRHNVGLEQPTYFGGKLFGGYRITEGDVEPWYQERVTNRNGEFNGGLSVPLLQGRRIDPRRAELWKATYGRTLTEYDIQEQGIEFTLAASMAYWDWVAAGEVVRVSEGLLELADKRVDFLKKQIEVQRTPAISMTDNQRMIVSRQAKLIEARQKLEQNALKLSLFLRTPQGDPIVAPPEALPPLPVPSGDPHDPAVSIGVALQNRPELRQLIVARRQLEVDLALAKNMMEPSVDATVYGSKDIGDPVDKFKLEDGKLKPKPDDKGPFLLEATLQVDVPLQRRKSRGKMQATEGKLAQNAAKRTYTENKITAEVQSVLVAIEASHQAYLRTAESVKLNKQMEDAERIKLELDRSDLLLLNLREQSTFEARFAEIAARLQYFQAEAMLRAVMAEDAATFADPDCVPAP